MRRDESKRGFAMVAVLLVLMALFVLCAPFLLTARNADQASAQMVDRASSRIAIDSALRRGRARLGDSHVGVDRTPYFDSVEELTVGNEFPEGFLDANDTNGVMWDLDVEDVAGRIDLNSASPHVLGNVLGGVARLTARALDADTELSVSSTAGFLDGGFVYLGGELIGYTERSASVLGALVRGLGVELGENGEPPACGPRPATTHDLGQFVLDQRMLALPMWRIVSGKPNRLGELDAIEQVAEVVVYAMAERLGDDFLPLLERTSTVHGGVGAGPKWQHGVRVVDTIKGLPDFGCVIPVNDARYFNAGTTVRITDGRNTEFGIVRAANKGGVRLMEELQFPFEPLETVIYALARRPVNINTASPEVLRALVLNLKLRERSARITSQEADELVRVIVVSRPFTGFEDFLRRVVLPSAGLEALPSDAPVEPEIFESLSEFGELKEDGTRALVGFMDADDAVALYKNALNANDADLEFSTMPFAFTSRDVYRMDLRASVNAPSGVERTRRSREEVDLIVPQKDLLRVWARQEDFDEEPRSDRHAPGWLSGPAATGRFDRVYESPWPSRVRAHLGKYDSRGVIDPPPPDEDEDGEADAILVFPSREDEPAWVQLAPSRAPDAQGDGARRVLHFDDETRDIEGRYLPDGNLEYESSHPTVGWTARGGMLRPLSFQAWIKPRALQDGSRYLDVASAGFPESDRVSLMLEDGDLVLRVLDAAGDHPISTFEEFAELRYPLSAGAGLPLDVWTHVEVGVAGTRPDQMRLIVDGRASAETPGLTRLTASLSTDAKRIQVESTEGFPDRCVVRIGDELIEVFKDGSSGFRAQHETLGGNAGFGGRIARERFDYDDAEGFNLGLRKDTQHAVGATVQLYGYSLPLNSQAHASSRQLTDSLGPFAVAKLVGVNGDDEESGTAIVVRHPTLPVVAHLGTGLSGGDTIESLELGQLDPGRDIEDVMKAFSPSGGYAAILSVAYTGFRFDGPPSATVNTDEKGFRVGGIEVVKYRSIQGNALIVTQRGGGGLANVNNDDLASGRGSFVLNWTQFNSRTAQAIPDINEDPIEYVKVIPISIPVRGADGLGLASASNSGIAQLTRLGGESDQTEWVRYDFADPAGYLVRDSGDALYDAWFASIGGLEDAGDASGLGGLDPPTSTPRRAAPVAPVAPSRVTPEPVSAQRVPAQGGGNYWHDALGEPEVEVEDYPITRAIASAFQFRGVFGTYSHSHPAGTPVLPTFKTVETDETGGHPGRFDHVSLIAEIPGYPVEPAVVQHAHQPFEYVAYSYKATQPDEAEPDTAEDLPYSGIDANSTWVALQGPLPVPFQPTAQNNTTRIFDTRLTTRMSMFPSGELPREVDQVFVGGQVGASGALSATRSSTALVPSAVVDEITFGTDQRVSQLVVAKELDASGEALEVRGVMRTTAGDLATDNPLGGLPRDAGLLRIGDEIVCYDFYDAESNTLHIPPGGRGLLGTDPQPHLIGEGAQLLESWLVSTLAGAMSSTSAEIPVTSGLGFPASGTVRIDDELIHYTGLAGGLPTMPRASEVPGAMDRKGAGLFRGRFGTEPAAHAATTPVIVFPFRYWDRWAEHADAPELHFFEFDADQPDAFWKRVFWDVEDPPVAGARFGVLQRTDPSTPWDANPDDEQDLDLLFGGRMDANGHGIGRQSSSAAWRAFVRYEPGAFDPVGGLSHGWKTTPKLTIFGIEFMGPNRVLRRIER